VQVLQGLQHMHENNIVHRDIKLENLLLQRKRNLSSVKVADMGFATRLSSHGKYTSMAGTPAYLAPEMVKVISGRCVGMLPPWHERKRAPWCEHRRHTSAGIRLYSSYSACDCEALSSPRLQKSLCNLLWRCAARLARARIFAPAVSETVQPSLAVRSQRKRRVA
jgi:serine/threonine protein kinase